MRKIGRWGLVFALLVWSMHVFAGIFDYRTIYDNQHYLAEGILQVLATDLDEDQIPEWVVAGKNYVGRELFIFWLGSGKGYQPVLKWQSSNLFEERSILWIASGRFSSEGRVLLVATNSKFYFYKANSGALQLIGQWNHNFEPLSLTAGDVDGDGYDELLVTRIADVTSQAYQCYVQIWKLTDTGWNSPGNTAILGNIRAVTTGDINGDGRTELVVEEGLRTNSGNIHVLAYTGEKFIELTKCANQIKGAAYGIKVKMFKSGMRLISASSRGKVNFFRWNGGGLLREPAELSLSNGLVDLDAADLDRDGDVELCIIGYPQRLSILKQQNGVD